MDTKIIGGNKMDKKLKVVVADDTAELGQSCERTLKSYGMDVILCKKDGLKVIEAIKQLESTPNQY